MIDLVINHSAIDSPLTRSIPSGSCANGTAASPTPPASRSKRKWFGKTWPNWITVTPAIRKGVYRHCLRIVEFLLSLGFDGFRCDAAYQVPRPFWQRLFREVKARHPHTCFVAETLGCKADQPRKLPAPVSTTCSTVPSIGTFTTAGSSRRIQPHPRNRALDQLPESHDTLRLCEELNGNLNGLKQRYLFAALFSAGVMMPMGFEFGFRKPLHVVRTTPADWEQNGIDLTSYIAKVNSIKRAIPSSTRKAPPASALPESQCAAVVESLRRTSRRSAADSQQRHLQPSGVLHRSFPAGSSKPARRCATFAGVSARLHPRTVPLRAAARPRASCSSPRAADR